MEGNYLPFDYVIELTPDDEYRQAAEALRSIQDFDGKFSNAVISS